MGKKDEYKNILFGYSLLPAYGWYGEDDGGFSIAVYTDGRFIYKTYIFDQIDQTETEYKLSSASVSALKALMAKHRKVIDAFDSHLSNGSRDGYGNFFVFNGKQVTTWNICYTNPILSLFRKEFRPVVKQENKILSIFYAASKVLKNDNIDLKLNEVSFRAEDGY